MYTSAASQPCVKRSPIATPSAVIRTVPMSARTASAVSRPVSALARCTGSTHIRLSSRRLAFHRDADRAAQGAEQRGQHRAHRDQAVNAVDAGDLMHLLAQHHLVDEQKEDGEEQRPHQHRAGHAATG